MQQQVWTMKIRPHEKLWHFDFKEIWRYRDLIELFVRRNIVVQYKQTILGPLWYLIQPILTVIMNMVVFGGIAKMSTDGMPQEHVWQGLFPSSGGAHRCGDIQFVAICHTGRTLCGALSLFLYGRCSYSPQLGYSVYAPIGHDVSRTGPWLWNSDLLAHHEVSRLHDSLHLYRPTLDVCYAYCLSTQYGGRRFPTHTDYGQPDDLYHRGFQVCHFGTGLFLLARLRL